MRTDQKPSHTVRGRKSSIRAFTFDPGYRSQVCPRSSRKRSVIQSA